MREDARESGARDLWCAGSGWAAMDLVEAVLAYPRSENWRRRRLELGYGDIPGRGDELKVGRVKKRGEARCTSATENATAFAAMLQRMCQKTCCSGSKLTTHMFALKDGERDAAEEVVTVDCSRVRLHIEIQRKTNRAQAENIPSREILGGGQRDARWDGGRP